MEAIRTGGRMTFDPKDFDEVAAICTSLVEDAGDHAGVLEYSYWANDARDAIIVREHYESAAAMLRHIELLDPVAIGRLLELVEPQPARCAAADTPANRDALAALAALGVVVDLYTPVALG